MWPDGAQEAETLYLPSLDSADSGNHVESEDKNLSPASLICRLMQMETKNLHSSLRNLQNIQHELIKDNKSVEQRVFVRIA